MNPSLLTRRQFATTLAGMAALSLSRTRPVLAQTPEASVNSVTTDIFSREITWKDPWVREGSGGTATEGHLVEKTVGVIENSKAVVDTVDIDYLTLTGPEGAAANFMFAPMNHEHTVEPAESSGTYSDSYLVDVVYTADPAIWFFLSVASVDSEDFGTINVQGLGRENDEGGIIYFAAPKAAFGDLLTQFQRTVTLDGDPALAELDAGDIQSRLDAASPPLS